MSCPMCRESACSIGFLGKWEWFECRYCGWKFAEDEWFVRSLRESPCSE